MCGYGHRNAQGLAFAVDGALFEAEHGPESDDEVNRLEPGRNYGLPQVAGFQDDQAYAYANWSASVDTPCDNADGTILYVATDVAGNTLGDDGLPTDVLVHPGAILALTTGD